MKDYKSVAKNLFEFRVKKCSPTLVLPEKETPSGEYYLSNLDQNKIRLNPNGKALSMENQEDRLFLLTSLEENIGMIVSTIYCFKSLKKGNESAAKVLKEALSKVLVPYYPFAGRLRVSSEEKLIVECTGEGAVFVEAEADCKMEDIGDPMNPNPAVLGKLIYDFTIENPQSILDIPLLMAQVTKFKCGGFILGFSLNHAMVDGVSGTRFVNAWGELARDLPLKVPPFLERTSLKSRNPPKIDFNHPEFEDMPDSSDDEEDDTEQEDEELEYKTFILDPKKLERIKYKAMEDKVLKKCTTFEALSAFVWRARVIATIRPSSNPNKPSKLVFPVDGRSRFDPPLPKEYFGNAIVLTSCSSREVDLVKNPLSYATGQVQVAIQGVGDGFLRSAVDYYEVTRARPRMRSVLLITTWARLTFYETDFGWGEPTHSGPLGYPVKEVVMFLSDGNDRDCIDLMVALPAYAMKKFAAMVDDV